MQQSNDPASLVSPTAAATTPAPVVTVSAAPSTLKKFSRSQIDEKVAKRQASVPEYASLLNDCKVREDADGVVFDSTHSSWHMLLHLCSIADTLEKEAKKKREAAGADNSKTEPPVVVYSKDFPLPPQRIDNIEPRGNPAPSPSTSATPSLAIPAHGHHKLAKSITPIGAHHSHSHSHAHHHAHGHTDGSNEQPSAATEKPQPPANQPEDEWVNVKLINKPVAASTSLPDKPSALSAAASSLFSQTAMSRASSALEKFSKIISARPQPPAAANRNAAAKSQNPAAHPAAGQKSGSNSSRDVLLVKEDLDFEAMIYREYQTPEMEHTDANATAQSLDTSMSSPAKPSEKDADLLSQFLKLIDPSVIHPDIAQIKAICKVIGVPHKHRGQLWSVLLSVKQNDALADKKQESEAQADAANASEETETVRRHRLATMVYEDETSAAVAAAEAAKSSDAALDPAVKFDLHNQRVIRADIERTLPHLRTFQTPSVRHDMEVVLTEYCKRKGVSYKQGMNYILAPLFLLNLSDRDAIYRLYDRFIAQLLNNTFSDNDFGSLQCTFLLFKMNLLYHDPELGQFLDTHDLGPELYASSWFITLFSNRCKLSVLFYLWDCLLLDSSNDQQLSFWVSLALLIHHRQTILSENIVMLPETLSKLSISSKKEASVLVNRAKKLYRSQSSVTCRAQLKDFTSRKISMDSIDYHKLLHQGVLLVSEEELVKSCYGDVDLSAASDGGATRSASSSVSAPAAPTAAPPATGASNVKFFILDCRPIEQYESGHLPCAYHLDPDLLQSPSELNDRVESLSSMKGCHFVFLGEGGERPETAASMAAQTAATFANLGQPAPITVVTAATATAMKSSAVVKEFIRIFLKKGFKYLANCESGYAGCHALVLASDHAIELIDHTPDCFECSGRRKVKEKKKTGFMQNVRRFAGNVISKFDSEAMQSVEEFQSQHLPDSAVILLTSNGNGANQVTSPTSSASSSSSNAFGSPSFSNSSLSLRLLHTVLRDKNADLSSFSDSLHRVTAVLVSAFLERVEWKERNVSTGAGSMYTGVEATAVCTITVQEMALELLDSAFHPFRPVCRRQSANYVFEALSHESGEKGDADAKNRAAPANPIHLLRHITVPSNLADSNVLIYFPILTADDAAVLFDILADLIHTRQLHYSQLTVMAIVAARPMLWKIHDAYPEILIIASCVDELTAAGRLIPGISNCEERYNNAK